MSSKKRPSMSKFSQAAQVKKKVGEVLKWSYAIRHGNVGSKFWYFILKVKRDPRFDDLSGQYEEEHFRKNYSFLSDIKENEKQVSLTTDFVILLSLWRDYLIWIAVPENDQIIQEGKEPWTEEKDWTMDQENCK